MPLVLGMGMFATTRSRYALMYVAVWPLMMLTTHFMQSRQQRKEHQAEVAAWRAEVAEVLDTLDDAARVQRLQLDADEPRTTELRSIAVSAEPRLWQRQRRHDDFLTVTTGRGPVPAACTAKPARSGDRTLRQEVEHRRRRARPAHRPAGPRRGSPTSPASPWPPPTTTPATTPCAPW